MSAAEICHYRAVCRKSRAAVDQWEPELWRRLIVADFIPEAWVERLPRFVDSSAGGTSRLWLSWKQLYIRLYLKARKGPVMLRSAQLLHKVLALRDEPRQGGSQQSPRGHRIVPRAEEVVAKLRRLDETHAKVCTAIEAQERCIATLRGEESRR